MHLNSNGIMPKTAVFKRLLVSMLPFTFELFKRTWIFNSAMLTFQWTMFQKPVYENAIRQQYSTVLNSREGGERSFCNFSDFCALIPFNYEHPHFRIFSETFNPLLIITLCLPLWIIHIRREGYNYTYQKGRLLK